LLVWAHGYTNPGPERAPFYPVELPSDEFGGAALRDVARAVSTPPRGNFGYATTSYRRNGLVAFDAVADLEAVTQWAGGQLAGLAQAGGFGQLPIRTYLVGASEGSLSTVLALETGRPTELFEGGLALCGPIGGFELQLNYFGDMRALYDYHFPGLMPGDPTFIPDEETTITDARWDATIDDIRNAAAADPAGLQSLLNVVNIPIPSESEAIEPVIDILRYSFFGTNDAAARLGGNPFDNKNRIYVGEGSAIDDGVGRFSADPAALAALADFETTGSLRVPTVVMHSAGDPVVPLAQATVYVGKVTQAGMLARLALIQTNQYGHCAFTLSEILTGLAVLIEEAEAVSVSVSASVFQSGQEMDEFLALTREQGVAATIERVP
jgi:pimeloyl-ACP methyl ester carboxylesterase